MFIVAWLLFFGLMFVFFLYYGQERQENFQVHRGVLTIKADKRGHYQLTGYINDKPVKFMLDTGATFVAIPEELAQELNIEGRYPITMQTANGEVTGQLTRLEKLAFADFILYNIKAVIIPGNLDNTVLMGMNVLSQFNLSQQDGQLVIKK
ncbi:MAG: retropepsin-like aspartic protease [Legionella sp.]|nr:retropepsin-like aspartic protease [Legionella sp.]